MKKKITFPVNKDCPLNKYEKDGLSKIINDIEWREYQVMMV